jgi:pimeloyl-ACP methyl ester carboxylesterase
VQQLVFEHLEKAQIGAALTDLDRRLTPEAFKGAPAAPGLRRWENGVFKPFDPAVAGKSKRILIFIHGTFSDSESLLTNGLMKSAPGQALLSKAEGAYDVILSFDHPTLSLSPALNAMDFAHVLRPLKPTQIDIVCHSRGGLVARWFCEVFCSTDVDRRVVLVASPIAGTSLASAPRVRDFFDFLTNVGDALRKTADLASFAAPWLVGVAGLMRLGTALTGGLARLPIADGRIALVPGLQGQARVGNNKEISRLQRGVATWHSPQSKLRYFAVTADFQPTDAGWNFLAYFRNIGTHALNDAADRLFPFANDLVVDTEAMTDLNGKLDAQSVQVQIADRHSFNTSSGVHHCNYFIQPDTISAIGTWLKIH